MLVWPTLIQVTEARGAESVTRQSTGRNVWRPEYWREDTAGSSMTVGRSVTRQDMSGTRLLRSAGRQDRERRQGEVVM